MNDDLNPGREPDDAQALLNRCRPGVLLTGAATRIAVAAALSAFLWAGLLWVTGGSVG